MSLLVTNKLLSYCVAQKYQRTIEHLLILQMGILITTPQIGG